MRDLGKNTQLRENSDFVEFNIKDLLPLRNISSCVGLVAMSVMNILTLAFEV